MTTLVTLAMVLPVLLLQRWYAARLDRTLPKRWRRLPILSIPYGFRSVVSRRAALYHGVNATLLMSAILVGLSMVFDLQQRPFELEKTLFANGCGLFFVCVVYLRGILFIHRWIRTGKPRIKGLKHPLDDLA